MKIRIWWQCWKLTLLVFFPFVLYGLVITLWLSLLNIYPETWPGVSYLFHYSDLAKVTWFVYLVQFSCNLAFIEHTCIFIYVFIYYIYIYIYNIYIYIYIYIYIHWFRISILFLVHDFCVFRFVIYFLLVQNFLDIFIHILLFGIFLVFAFFLISC